MKELAWLLEAKKHISLKETVGANHNPVIQAWLKDLGAWWKDDETPWCGVFVAHCLKVGGRDLPKNWFRAKEYETYGLPLKQPAYGCVVTFTRQGGGHVGFVIGEDGKGNLLAVNCCRLTRPDTCCRKESRRQVRARRELLNKI